MKVLLMVSKLLSHKYFFTVVLVISLFMVCDRKNYFTDPQENKYETVILSNQEWMAKNLRYDIGDGFYCYENNSSQCIEIGGLYTWAAALNAAEKIEGWHLPSKEEWQELIKYYSGEGGEYDSLAYINLMSDTTGFNPQWAGVRISTGIFKAKELKGVNYWSSTPSDTDTSLAYSVGILSKFKIVSPHNYPKLNACSVRLVKDD
jgi:uncharacterized protein (TIGR02145 family)